MPVCPPVSPYKGASIISRRASCAMHKHFYAWNSLLCGWGCALCQWKCLLCGWGCALCVWKRLLYGGGMCSLQMETALLRVGMCLLRMETPLRGRSGGHTGAAPTISRVAPCPKVAGRGSADGLKQEKVAGRGSADRLKQEKVAGRGSADGLKQEKVAGRGSADGLKRKTHPEKRISGVGFRLNMLRKWLSWRLDCEILHFFIIFAAEKIKPI